MQCMHRLVGSSINHSLGRWESFWAVELPSLVRLQDDEDVRRESARFVLPIADEHGGLMNSPPRFSLHLCPRFQLRTGL